MASVVITFGIVQDNVTVGKYLGLDPKQVSLEAKTLRDALCQLALMSPKRTPEYWLQMFFDDQGQMRRTYTVSFQDERNARQNLDAPLRDGDKIYMRVM